MHDMIIVGGGPAGLTAGIYAQRAGVDALLIEKYLPGGQAVNAPLLDNYPGADGLSGAQLIDSIEKQARRLGLTIVADEIVDLQLSDDVKKLVGGKETYEAKTVVLALGASHRKLGLEGEDALLGRGLSYCATCDGAFFRNMDVAIVGGGDTAAMDALFLSRLAKSVTLVHRRDALRAAPLYSKLVRETPNIHIEWDSVVVGFEAQLQLSGLKLRNVKTGAEKTIEVAGVFVAIGNDPQTALLEGKLALNEGRIPTDADMRTQLSGVFAAGDARDKSVRQIVTAAADGAIAAVKAAEYILSE